MRQALIAATLAFPMLATAQRSTNAETTCLGLLEHADTRNCLIAEAAKSDSRLERAERDLRQAVRNWQEDESFKRRAIAAQTRARAEFLRARSAQCEFQATLAAGGNGAGDRKLLCWIELNDRRVSEVESIAASIR